MTKNPLFCLSHLLYLMPDTIKKNQFLIIWNPCMELCVCVCMCMCVCKEILLCEMIHLLVHNLDGLPRLYIPVGCFSLTV